MIHQDQSAFIKGRSIHENFQFVQASAKALHARRLPQLLLKVDISKAFDSVAWPFLLHVMEHIGFPRVTTKVAVNGSTGEKILHARGLRQGDPLLPMLFLLVMEVLSPLIRRADNWSLLQPLGVRAISHRLSLYADNLVLFLTPTATYLQLTKEILKVFEGASGLACSMAKCHIAPIRCQQEHIEVTQQHFPCILTEFPIKYLGIPLSTSKLPKSALQPILDAVADRLPTWKGQLLHRSGRLTLIKTTLTAIPIHLIINLNVPSGF